MTMNTNLFCLSINMVSISISQKEKKGGKVLISERKLKEKDETRLS